MKAVGFYIEREMILSLSPLSLYRFDFFFLPARRGAYLNRLHRRNPIKGDRLSWIPDELGLFLISFIMKKPLCDIYRPIRYVAAIIFLLYAH